MAQTKWIKNWLTINGESSLSECGSDGVLQGLALGPYTVRNYQCPGRKQTQPRR